MRLAAKILVGVLVVALVAAGLLVATWFVIGTMLQREIDRSHEGVPGCTKRPSDLGCQQVAADTAEVTRLMDQVQTAVLAASHPETASTSAPTNYVYADTAPLTCPEGVSGQGATHAFGIRSLDLPAQTQNAAAAAVAQVLHEQGWTVTDRPPPAEGMTSSYTAMKPSDGPTGANSWKATINAWSGAGAVADRVQMRVDGPCRNQDGTPYEPSDAG